MLRKLTVTPALNGWIVKVGCQTVVFETTEGLLQTMGEYLSNPNETEKQWTEMALNAKHTVGCEEVRETPENELAVLRSNLDSVLEQTN